MSGVCMVCIWECVDLCTPCWLLSYQLAGHQLAGHQLAGHQLAGYQLAGYQLAGYWMTDYQLAGYWLTGGRQLRTHQCRCIAVDVQAVHCTLRHSRHSHHRVMHQHSARLCDAKQNASKATKLANMNTNR